MKSWPLKLAFLFFSLPVYLSAQSLPASFNGKWFDAENPLSTFEIVPGAPMIVLPTDLLNIQEVHRKGELYEVVVLNSRNQMLRLSFKNLGDQQIQFALLPNVPRTFTQSPSPQRTDQAFALDLKIGETYHLDIRTTETIHDPENERKWGTNRLRELIERSWYEYQVVSQPTADTYLLEMKVKRVLRITRYQSGFVNYKDSQYHLPDDQNRASLVGEWAPKQRFRVTINQKGQILDHRIQTSSGDWIKPKISAAAMIFTHRYEAGNLSTLEHTTDQPAYLWSVLSPRPSYNSIASNMSGSAFVNQEKYILSLFDFLTDRPNDYAEKRGRITRYSFPNQSLIALDDRNGWIKYGRITSETADRRLEITLSGWSEQHRTAVITGKIVNPPVSISEMERYVKRYLKFWQSLPVDFQVDPDGSFRLSCDPGKVLYTPENQIAPLFLRPGDSLHLVRDYSRDLYLLDFSGDAAIEQAVAIRQSRKLGKRDIGKKSSTESPAEFKSTVKNIYQPDSLYLDQVKSLVDPVFYQKAQWDLRYFAANALLAYWKSRFHHILRPSPEAPPDLLQILGTLPVNNDQAVGLAEYRHFLHHTYLDYKTSKVRNFFRGGSSLKSLGDEYALAKYIYTGEPLFDVLAVVLRDQLYYDMVSPTSSYSILNEFRNYNPDSTVNRQFEQAHAQLMELEPGSRLPEFTLLNSSNKRMISTECLEDKTLFIPFGQKDIYLTGINFDSLRQWYPDLKVILLSFFPPDEAENLLPSYLKTIDPDLVYFIPEEEERRKIHDHFHLYNFNFPRPSFNRAYLVNDQGMIFDNFQAANLNSSTSFIELKDKIDGFMNYQPPPSLNSKAFFLIISSLGLGGLLVWLFKTWQNQLEKRRRKMIELEIKALRAQLNPHFIFNTMSSIQNLIASERPELANEYLADLAALLRKVLRHTQRGTVSLTEELDLIRQYCALECLRKPFELNIYNEVGHAANDIELPALILQPYVENAILHGLGPINGEARIDIIVESIGRDIVIQIIDNGIGLQATALKHSNGNNIGLKTNAERLKLLFGGKAKVHLTDRQSNNWDHQGTIVELQIPQI